MQLKIALALAACCLLTACGHREVLTPLSGYAPPGVDFTGTWELREDDSADHRSILQAIDSTDGVKNTKPVGHDGSGSRAARPTRSGRSTSGLAHVFLETGSSLKITQTQHGFFVSVDRSKVVEFRFGEQRMVNVGEIEAQRVSGWEDDAYIVETLDKKGMKLIERFWISDDDSTLNREITFRSRKLETESVMQFFDRVDSS